MRRYPFLSRFRRLLSRFPLLHAILIATLVLLPSPGRGYWSDLNNDEIFETWTDAVTNQQYSVAQLDAISQDIDEDGASNDEELQYGSDPFDFDSDDDGIDDGTEIHLAIQTNGCPFSLTEWDSNGNFISDFDEFHQFYGLIYTGGVLPDFPGASYSDYDGDGIKNPFDPYPADPLNNDQDGDGIDDSDDPSLGDANNFSSYNSTSWYGAALNDDDGDAILNFWDPLPSDPSNGSSDTDGDGIGNSLDPYPEDNSNYSSTNGIYWYGDLFGDADGDAVLNHEDPYPYDSNNGGGSGLEDDDGDGIGNNDDPAPNDATNNSPYNNVSWYGAALEDMDDDGQTNFLDPYPEDTFDNIADFDGDGVVNPEDPYPKDSTNFSSINGVTWNNDLFEDADSDGTVNWNDAYPYDANNGNDDIDADGISNSEDPFPEDPNNFSAVNNIAWGVDALGDSDSDGTPNWQDETPYPSPNDGDGDGFADDVDPLPGDSSNVSPSNGIAWGGDIFGDADGDQILNWEDPLPYDFYNGDTDADDDGIANESDPAPLDFDNYSPYNSTAWYSGALDDADYDNIANFYDYNPYISDDVDSDGDGILDSIDPYPGDATNYSSINYISWYSDVNGDYDGDGTPNHADTTPYGVPPPEDSDQDGLDADQENQWGTSDNDWDSDDDGLADGEEVNVFGSDPLNKFSRSQLNGWGTLYTDWQMVDLSDADSDGIPDRIEEHYNLNPNWADDGALDLDNNGLSNRMQFEAGIALDADLTRYDADGDGISDIAEDYYALNKLDAADAVLDADDDGVTNYEETVLLLSPLNADTTGRGGLGDLELLMLALVYPQGGAPGFVDVSPENGIADWMDAALQEPVAVGQYHFARVASGDLDGDGLPDAWEHEYGLWNFHTNPTGLDLRVDDAQTDNDADDLTNVQEYSLGTSPLAGDDPDIDGDGMPNAYEILHGLQANVDDRYGDQDGDGIPNFAEFLNGSDPNDAEDLPGNARLVGSPAYPTLMDALVPNPPAGTIVLIPAGSHTIAEGGVVLQNQIFLIGRNADVFATVVQSHETGDPNNQGVIVAESDIYLANLALTANGPPGTALRLVNESHAAVIRSVFRDHLTAVQSGSDSLPITGSLELNGCLIFTPRIVAAARTYGLKLFGSHSLKIYFSTFFGQQAATASEEGASVWHDGDALSVDIRNAILWNEAASEVWTAAEEPVVSIGNSFVRNIGTNGSADIKVRYGFLLPSSPCINVASSADPKLTLDIRGDARVSGGAPDIGAHEFSSQGSNAWDQDFDGDGIADWKELQIYGSFFFDRNSDGDQYEDGVDMLPMDGAQQELTISIEHPEASPTSVP